MSIDISDPKMKGYLTLEVFQTNDASSSSRRIREDSDAGPVSMKEIKCLFESLKSCADDNAAAAEGISVGSLYRTGSTIKVRVS